MLESKHRLHWLDSLRGLAALLVTVIHLFATLRVNYPHTSLFAKGGIAGLLIFDFLDAGRIGVVLFFFVSGFVIPYSILNKGLKHFGISRVFRLYPAYWVSIILAILVNGIISFKIVLVNVTMFQKFLGVDDLIGVYWTLQIEIIFYILCAILYKKGILNNDKVLIKFFYGLLCFSLLLALCRYVTEKKLPVALFLGMCVMFMGLAYRKYLFKEGSISKRQIIIVFAAFLTFLLPICLLAYNKDYGFDEKWYKYFVSYFIAIVFFLVYSFYKWTNKVLAYLGTISYSLYLIHVLVFDALDHNSVSKSVSSLVYTLIFYVVSFCLATLCYYLVEKPAVAYGRKILNK